MKKLFIVLFTVFLNTAFFSCNPESLTDEVVPQACCDEGEDIPPPPPPPDPDPQDPPGGTGG